MNRFEHLIPRQKSACYFIMKTLRVYLKDNETPEEFLNKYLEKAKEKAGWKDVKAKAKRFSVPILPLEFINKHGVEREKDLKIELLEWWGYDIWKE